MELVKAITESASFLSQCCEKKKIYEKTAHFACYETGSDLSVYYEWKDESFIPFCMTPSDILTPPMALTRGDQSADFILDCRDYLVSARPGASLFSSLYLNGEKGSAAALPLIAEDILLGLIVVNGATEEFYDSEKLSYLEALSRMGAASLARIESSRRKN